MSGTGHITTATGVAGRSTGHLWSRKAVEFLSSVMTAGLSTSEGRRDGKTLGGLSEMVLDREVQELMDLARQIYNEYNEELRKASEKFKSVAERDYDVANDELWLDFVSEAQDKIYKKYKNTYVDIFHEDYVSVTVGKGDWLVSYSDGEWEIWNSRTGKVEFIEEKERGGRD